MRILLIEDHPAHAFIARSSLGRAFGAERIDHAADLASALAALESRSYDALASDWDLGHGETAEPAIRRYRQLHHDGVCVVFSSHHEAQRMALSVGADQFVDKAEDHSTTARLGVLLTDLLARAGVTSSG